MNDLLPSSHYQVIDATNEAVRSGARFTYYDVWKTWSKLRRESRYY